MRIATRGLGDHVDALGELLEDLRLDPSDGPGVVEVDANGERRSHARDVDALGTQGVGEPRFDPADPR